jgi:signal transduction histidine kinase
MASWLRRRGAATGSRPLAAIALLALGVLVPTLSVLWFMSEAVRNERLAVRQQVEQLYRSQLRSARDRLEERWRERLRAFLDLDRSAPASLLFAAAHERGLADGLAVYGLGGGAAYPEGASDPPAAPAPGPPAWTRARRLEFRDRDPAAAAEAYAGIARRASDTELGARALQAEARCRAAAGETERAIGILTEALSHPRFREARDARGRLIRPAALLRGLQLLDGPADPRFGPAAETLARLLGEYGNEALSSAQRRFLMKSAARMVGPEPFPTLEAEELAAAYVERHPEVEDSSPLTPFYLPETWEEPGREEPVRLHPSRVAGLWQLALPDTGLVALYRHETVVSEAAGIGREQGLPRGAEIRLLPPGEGRGADEAFAQLPAGPTLPGWQLALGVEESLLVDAPSGRRVTLYIWAGGLLIALFVLLATLAARFVGRQMRAARLKNDLVATVSHELKTPLASIRLLVDTLLEGEHRNERRTLEYLELIARENARLSRLIDNFLSFSRMERNKRSFELARTVPATLVEEAVGAVRERFEAAGFRIEAEIAPDLPEIRADRDALITVLLNLLDNAYKYSDDDRRVAVRAREEGGRVLFEVEDHGIGMSPRASRRAFDRFYQVDESLARRTGGCGLGLSIVKFIVEAHGGRVRAESRPGEGSRFTVELPKAG